MKMIKYCEREREIVCMWEGERERDCVEEDNNGGKVKEDVV